MTEEEKIICKQFLDDADKTHSCNEYKLLMALLEQEPTTKNDLGVDCISREQAKEAIRDKFKDLPSRVEINTILNELPSVTPQEPILDKIRAEIEHTEIVYDKSTDYKDDRTDAEKAAVQWKMDKLIVLGIIDKYKAETEEI